MAFIVLRCFILYFAVIIAVRMMGKRQIGQLQPIELVITILISELAAMPMQDTDQPVLSGILPIFTLAAVELIVSLIALKSVKIRRLLYGRPVALVSGGKVRRNEMERARVSVDDLLEAMRSSGITKLEDVEHIILETNGSVSVISKPEKQPVTPSDVNIKPSDDGAIPTVIITDGRIIKKNIPDDLSDDWLKNVFAGSNIKDADEVFLMTRDSSGRTNIIKKEQTVEKEPDLF